MNKKFFFSLSSLALAIVLAVCGVSVYAWFSATDRASEMEFKFARINSEVYFYRANDENKNGVPDRIEEGYWTDKNITNFPEAYFPKFRGAYSFEFIGKREAKVKDLVTTEDTISFSGESGNSLADIVPSKVFTYRFRMVNKGDSTNNVSILINAGSAVTTNQQAKLLLKTLAVSCGEDAVAAGANAGKIVKQISTLCGGGGGGRPDSASAGGKDASKLDEALAQVKTLLA